MDRYSPVSPLIYWVRERENIRLKRSRGELAPWTTDPILAKYRFCNVRRKDDRVSQWIINNVLAFMHMGFSPWSFLQFSAICRWVNWPPTLRAMHDERLWPRRKLDLRAMGQFIDARCNTDKAWTGAYMVRAAPKHQYPDITKGCFVTEIVVGQGMDSVRKELERTLVMKNLQAVHRVLQSVMNWGDFMAGQVVADWTYTPLLEHASDIIRWAPRGPGSMRGANRLLYRPLNQLWTDEEEWCATLQGWRQDIIDKCGVEFRDLTLHDTQNCLCEVDKFMRVKTGEGKPRALYQPADGF